MLIAKRTGLVEFYEYIENNVCTRVANCLCVHERVITLDYIEFVTRVHTLFYFLLDIGILYMMIKRRSSHIDSVSRSPSLHCDFIRKPRVSDPDLYHGTCVTHYPWRMSGSLIRGGRENVPGIPGACASRNWTYLARGPRMVSIIPGKQSQYHVVDVLTPCIARPPAPMIIDYVKINFLLFLASESHSNLPSFNVDAWYVM